jgi:hypothetical protein
MNDTLPQLERELFCAERNFVEHYNLMTKQSEEVECWRSEIKSLILRIDRLKNKCERAVLPNEADLDNGEK